MTILYIGQGTFASGAAALSVGMPAGIEAGDLLLLMVETANQAVATPSGWTQAPNSPQGTGTAAAAGGVRLTVFYKVAGSSESAVDVADSGDHQVAVVSAYRGVDPGQPINSSAGSVQAATVNMVFPGVVTTVPGTLVVLACAQDTDANSTATASGYANATLTDLVEQLDRVVNTNAGGGLVFLTATMDGTGATGNVTATGSTSVTHAYLTLALKPAPVLVDLEGVASATAVAGANLAIQKALASSAVAVASGSADLSVTLPGVVVDLAAAGSAQAGGSAALLRGVSLSALALSQATASGGISLAVPLQGAAVAVAGGGAQIALTVALGAQALSLAQGSGALQVSALVELGAAAVAYAQAGAALTTQKPLQAQAVASAGGAAELASAGNQPLAAQGMASAGGAAVLWLQAPLSAQATAQAHATGAIAVTVMLDAAALAAVQGTAHLVGDVTLSAQGLSVATAQAVLQLGEVELRPTRGYSALCLGRVWRARASGRRAFQAVAKGRSWRAVKGKA